MNRQLLIIDDDRATHDLVCAHLASTKTECISALDGIAGIQRAVESKPSAILLDMEMPLMNGMEVCLRLKAHPRTREIPIMFLTGDLSMNSKVQGIEFGAVDYMTKPFDPFELRARVRSVFRAADAIESVHALAGIDETTGLWNRAYLFRRIETFVATATRTRQMVSCCFAALDRFDELATKTGQPGGADLFREAAELVFAAVRAEDVVCRYDTETLAVLGLASDRKTGRAQAERVRACVSEIGLRSFIEAQTVTCSVGLAVACDSVGPAIVRAAEQALAEAQMVGNQIVQLSPDWIDSTRESNPFN